jgi:hypothetical protein
MMFEVPVLFIIFNRKNSTEKVFEQIRLVKPKQLFIAADGPRKYIPGEDKKCENIRSWILENIDWNCEIKTLFRDQNIGCGRGPSEAITWFFEHVNEGIILEDDCLPNISFFKFCDENLNKYRNYDNISIISGNNFQIRQPMIIGSDYYFSVFPSTWGWATWKRSWDGFDYHIRKWKTIEQKEFLNFLFREKQYQGWWKWYLDKIYNEQPDDMWDFQFYFHCIERKQLAVIPGANLVSNIGHGPMASHTTNKGGYFDSIPAYELEFPLKHPDKIQRNYDADLFVQKMLFGEVEIISLPKKFKRLAKKILNC